MINVRKTLPGPLAEGDAIIVYMYRLRTMNRMAATSPWDRALPLLVIGAICLTVLSSATATAARVSDLYAATGVLPADSESPLADAFNEALGKVLVKVTGRRDAAAPDFLVTLFPDPAKVVQQYRREGQETIWARFDRDEIKRVLDGSGQPVWGEDRPVILIWLALDAGRGQRSILPAESEADVLPIRTDEALSFDFEQLDEVRVVVVEAAESRGIPVLLPLVDAEDLSRLSFAELWGDFSDPVMAASERYGADAVLIGRARSAAAPGQQVRWSLLQGDERIDWQGSLADGPNATADWLGGRLATYADSAGKVRLSVGGVNSLDDYGALTSYLKSIAVVDSFDVSRVNGDHIEFVVTVRGDSDRLMRAIRSGRMLQPITGAQLLGSDPWALPGYRREPDLAYTLVPSP